MVEELQDLAVEGETSGFIREQLLMQKNSGVLASSTDEEELLNEVPEPREVSSRDFISDGEVSASGSGLINGFTILAAARARLPEEVHVADLSGQGYDTFEEEDLEYFHNLRLLDLSDNRLGSVEELSRLRLTELRAPVNNLRELNVSFRGAFASLKVLDVSYNELGPKALEELSTLSSLTKLDMSGNNLGGLERLGLKPLSGFPRLRTLVLEQAKLRSTDLTKLKQIPWLSELKMANNPIEEIPPQCEGGFASLEVIDLSFCALLMLDSVAVAQDFPKLRKVLMHGNNILPQGRLSRHPLSSKVSLEKEDKGLGLAARKKGFTVSQMYNINMKKADLVTPNSRMQAFCNLTEEEIDEAFERLKDPMSIFSAEDYETVEGASTSQGEGEKEEESSTFLTSLVEEEDQSESEAQEELDPSSKLAKAFGLDPGKIFSVDHLGLDATAAINALKFALNHPLVDYNDTGKIEHHMKLTESAQRRKLETRRISSAVTTSKPKASKRKEAIQDMLARMKEKLAIAKEKIAAVPAS
ncbi:hypothetical protein HOP50_09g57240 [Chloropicon primus]|nr:hypothetical protein HOP50_09g57240 [Chloropicon primus]